MQTPLPPTDRLAAASSDQFLAEVLDTIPAIIWIMDEGAAATFCNQFFCEFSGCRRDELLGSGWIGAVHPEDRAACLAALRAHLEKRARYTLDFRLRRADGEYRQVRHQGQPCLRAGGGLAGFVGSCVDITDPQRAGEALRASEERFRVAAGNASDVIYAWDIPTDRILILGGSPERLGFSGAEIPQSLQQWEELLHPEDRARVMQALDRSLKTREPLRIEYRSLRGDGVVQHWQERGAALYDAAGAPRQFVGVLTEITGQKRSQEDLLRLAAIVRTSDDAISSGTLDGILMTWNPGAEKLYGYSPEEALGRFASMLIPPRRRHEMAEIRERIQAGEPVVHFETTRMRKDGAEVAVSLNACPMRDPAGNVIGVSVIARDITERKRTEAALRDSERRLELAQAAAGIGIFDWNLREDRAACSDGYFRLYGLEARGEVSPGEWLQRVHPGDRERMVRYQQQALRNRPDFETDFRVIWPDGSVHWLISKGKVYRDETGRAVRLVGANLDITQLKRAQQALEESEQKYRNLFETMAQGVIYQNASGEVISANPAAARILGVTVGQILERHPSHPLWRTILPDGTSIPPESRPSAVALRSGSEIRDVIVGVFNQQRQEYRWLSVNVMPQFRAGEDKPYQAYTIFQDITERLEAEKLLRASEERFRLLIEHGSEIISIIDAEGRFRYVSPSVQAALGYEPNVLIGALALDLVHPEDLAAARDALARVGSTPGITVSTEFRVRHGDGSWRFLESVATNLLQVRGLEGIVINSRDTSERKRIEQELRSSHDRLRQLAAHVESVREQERIRIAREIHDEMGQLLSMLKLDLEGLGARFRPAEGAPQRDYTERIVRMVNNVERTIKTVRRIAAELRPGILDHLGLAAAIDWQIQEFQSRTGIQCLRKALPEDIPLSADQSTAVFRIFQEILTNVARHANATAVSIEMKLKSGRLTLRVSDNGKGLAEQHLSDPRSLGLLGMRERALLLGGSVEFASRPGSGTAVTLRIPLDSGTSEG